MRTFLRLGLAAILAALGPLGCATVAPNLWWMMKGDVASHPAPSSPPGMATVVFFVADERSFGFGDPTDAFFVIDEKGQLLGALKWGSWFAAQLPPGEHAFFEWDPYVGKLFASPIDAAAKGTLSAGATYWVQITTKPRPFYQSAVLPHFNPVAGGADVVAGLQSLAIDPSARAEWESIHAADVRTLVAAGKKKIDQRECSLLR